MSIVYGSYTFANTFAVTDEGSQWTVPRTLLPRRAGGRFLAGYKEPRRIVVSGAIVKGPFDTSLFQPRLDALIEALELGPQTLTIRSNRHYRNVDVEDFDARYEDTMFCRMVMISINMLSPHPYEFADSETSDTWPSPSSGGTHTVTTAGDAFSLPQYRITVSSSGTLSLTLTNSTTGQVFTLSGAVVSGDIIVVDTLDETVTIASSNQMDMFDGEWPQLNPGANLLSLSYSGVTVSQLETKWRDRW